MMQSRTPPVKTFKTMVAPFDTRLGPILKTIDENYAILRQEAEIQFMIYQFQRHCSMQRDLSEIKEDHGRIIGILEGTTDIKSQFQDYVQS